MKENRLKLKKYRIHIIPALALNDSIWELPFERNALILCTKNYWYIASRLPLNEVLYLDFPDVDNEHYLGAFDELNAREIIGFIKNLPLSVTDLYICCSMGASRSAAVAASVLRMSGRSDRVIWDNSYYKPNALVYSFLCREAHIFAPHWYIKQLQNINEMAHQKDSGNKSIYDDERWQIIE